ncbi:3-hydroxyacyl-CoA dehydrogenase family protein [Streptomyces sp. NBC_01334]|uniref:3-hydroxyacyl-CoA dehydrogenase family protein n=1 Tax=Streptomyces sp. NBC_01334 TaxID=2903827 RepID=UPI002E159C03|nr:3-hydroxyacyl-CoA dehydrogenase NAD-binding domain-containing protein [Streptomyces sp. NBC_01334]
MTQQTPVIGVIGLGTIGSALLTLLRDAPREVIGVDNDPSVLARLSGQLKATGTECVTLTGDIGRLSRADLVVEAVGEDEAVKTEVLRRLRTVCPDETVVVSTTAAVPLTRLAALSGRPANTMGLRFLTPPRPGGPVEAVRTTMTSQNTAAFVDTLVGDLGLKPVTVDTRCAADATALVYAYLNRATALYERGGASRDGIDTAMRLGCGLPLGPLELLDRIGIDSALATLTDLNRRTGDASFLPAGMLGELVEQGRLGRKSGRGFYAYDASGRPVDAEESVAVPGTAAGVYRVAVVGSGTMARGIAEITSVAGFPTVLVARSEEKVARSLAKIGESLSRGVLRGRVAPATKAAALDLLDGSDDLRAVSDCDLVIEAVVEDLDVKRALFARLGAACKPGALLATTTSSLSVTACSEPAGHASGVVGMHFFNPAPVMRLVELVRTDHTTDEALATAQAVCERLGKTTVHCRDRVGFIVNYLLFPYLGRALTLLDRHGTSVEGIDTAVEQGFGHPMGPFALLDAIGLDVSLAIQRELHAEFGEPDFAPSPLLELLVSSGWLGRKNRKGLRTAG